MAGGPEPILLSILIIIIGAKLGGEVAERIKQPAVLGELLMGILLGASLLGGYVGLPDFAREQEFHHEEELIHDAEHHLHEVEAQEAALNEEGASQAELDAAHNETMAAEAEVHEAEKKFGAYMSKHGPEIAALEIIGALATIGVILLLFEVGLESDVKELTKVGASSLLVAFIGIAASFAMGYGFSYFLTSFWDTWAAAGDVLPNNLLHIFVGATLTATSVGITARVLGDMGKLNTNETKIILGAAVLDDIGGLIILAIMAALISATLAGESVDTMALLLIAGKAIGFLVVALALGLKFVPKAYDGMVETFRVKGFPVALAIAFALLMAYLATVFGLADIVGAFAGGLILAQTKAAHRIFEDLRPIGAIFISFFFVTLGMKVDLTQMTAADGTSVVVPVILIGVVLTLIAMAAKLACGWGVLKNAGASKLVVGVGMSPRGEVGLIFAVLGLNLGLILNWQYTAIIFVVMLTTFITPIWLKKLEGAFVDDEGGDGGQKKREGMSKILDA
ncbi:MAG: cation:proton antiporter [Thermoplasmatota archaeon]